jgi:AcrR family transcriptional regulator
VPAPSPDQRRAWLEEECLLIHHSGELPVLAFYGALQHLTEAPEGPRLTLAPAERDRLREAVAERFRRILRRDLDPRLRRRSVYRGLERCAANWGRWEAFCRREGLPPHTWRGEIAAALTAFLERELADAASGADPSIDCPAPQLAEFACALGLDPAKLPPGWEALCPPA